MFDGAMADRAVRFIQQLNHTKGVWHGVPFDLLPWQETLIRDILALLKQMGTGSTIQHLWRCPRKMAKVS